MRRHKINLITVVPVVFGLIVFFRIIFANANTFSYDYANYLSYFSELKQAEWSGLVDTVFLTFPYVLIPGGGLFEIGFVALAKTVLTIFPADATYALLAAGSVALRTFLLRRLGLEWTWIAITQIFTITMFEANALRAGVALTMTLWSLSLMRQNKIGRATLVAILAVTQHLQALIFLTPFAFSTLIPLRWLRNSWLALMTFFVLTAITTMANVWLGGIQTLKLGDYIGQTSSAVGVNLASVLSAIFVLLAIIVTLRRSPIVLSRRPGDACARVDAIWIRSLYASMPALCLLIFGVELSAIGDRAWQFALSVLIALSTAMRHVRVGSWLRVYILSAVLSVTLTNVLVRYPLSNFFSPPFPYERIEPLFLVI